MGPLLRQLEKALGKAALSSEGSPKTSYTIGVLSIAGSVYAMFGFNPEVVNQFGAILVRFGELLVKF